MSLRADSVFQKAAMADSKRRVKSIGHFTYIWTIENMRIPCILNSPTFTVQAMDKTKWRLSLDCDITEPMELKIFRESEDDGPDSIEIKFELSFLGVNGLPLIRQLNCQQFCKGGGCLFRQFANESSVFIQRRAEFLPRDALTVRCRMWRAGTEISKPDLCFARTLLRPDRHSFVWTIRGFSTLQRGQKRQLLLNPTSRGGIQLILNFFIKEENGEEYVCIGIEDSTEIDHSWYNIQICILGVEGNVVYSKNAFVNIESHINFFTKRKLMNEEASLIPNDVLCLRCEIQGEAKTVWSRIETCRHINSMGLATIAKEMDEVDVFEPQMTSIVSSSFTEAMKSLLEEGTLTDVSLRAGSKLFPAHKCILSARSSVFKAMFSRDMMEKTSQFVEITDVNEDTLRELLSYIYTDSVGELEWRGAADLYRAADKYELLDLKRRCSTFLKSEISVSSICTVLVVADMHHDQGLREKAQDFVMRQDAEFFASDTWRNFKKENSYLAMEIMEQIVCNIKSHQ
ncbi:Protein roadkill [Araneus ventricosus]|uniref:Protein roadkill n=1 Tax=Araneus ventricosus TaxID=182803 RepID=A0A4Y2IGR5_ARAVE|nr:Protein roadkill [Araneus ventricosus]